MAGCYLSSVARCWKTQRASMCACIIRRVRLRTRTAVDDSQRATKKHISLLKEDGMGKKKPKRREWHLTVTTNRRAQEKNTQMARTRRNTTTLSPSQTDWQQENINKYDKRGTSVNRCLMSHGFEVPWPHRHVALLSVCHNETSNDTGGRLIKGDEISPTRFLKTNCQ
jgi:hypothetical protein